MSFHVNARSAILLLALVAMPTSCRGQEPRIDHSAATEPFLQAVCYNNIHQGIFALAHGILAMYEGAVHCRKEEEKKSSKLLCAISVTEAIEGTAFASFFLSSAANDCIEGIYDYAYCAADVSSFVTALTAVANSALTMNVACGENGTALSDSSEVIDARRLSADKSVALEAPLELARRHARRASGAPRRLGLWEDHIPWPHRSSIDRALMHKSGFDRAFAKLAEERRKSEKMSNEAEKEERQVLETECALDIGAATGSLMRAGLAITDAKRTCTEDHPFEEDDEKAKSICTINIAGIIGSFAFVAEFLSFATSHCPEMTQSANAECSGAISDLLGTLMSFTAFGTSIKWSCGPDQRSWDEAGVGVRRRLASNTSDAITTLI